MTEPVKDTLSITLHLGGPLLEILTGRIKVPATINGKTSLLDITDEVNRAMGGKLGAYLEPREG